MTRSKGKNIHTQWIQDALGVTVDVALRVQDRMNEMNYVDWSEDEMHTIHVYAMLAFEDLNKIQNF